MVNVYDSANQLEEDLRKSDEVMGLQVAYNKMKADSAAYDMFQKTQELQEKLQNKQMSGQKLADEDIKELQELTKELAKYDSIKELMEQEKKVNSMMDEINKIVSKPIADIYK